MAAVLAYVRGRPWLAPCLMSIGLGLSVAALSVFGRIGFWLGILVIIGGLLMALACEIGYRRERTSRQGADTRS